MDAKLFCASFVIVCFAFQLNKFLKICSTTEDEVYRKVPKEERRYNIFDTLFAFLWSVLGAAISIIALYNLFTGEALL